jgi:hypothetical protein
MIFIFLIHYLLLHIVIRDSIIKVPWYSVRRDLCQRAEPAAYPSIFSGNEFKETSCDVIVPFTVETAASAVQYAILHR